MLASRSQACTRCAARLTATASRAAAAPYSTLPEATGEAPTGKAVFRNQARKPYVQKHHGREGQSRESQAAMDIFNDVVKPYDPEDAAGTVSLSSADWKMASRLRALSSKTDSIEPVEKLRSFKTEIGPYLETAETPMHKQNYVFATNYLGKIAQEVAQKGTLGVSVELSQLYGKLGGTNYELNGAMVLNLCFVLSQPEAPPETAAAAERELIDLWKHLSQTDRPSQAGKPLKFTFPSDADQLLHLSKVPRSAPNNGSKEAYDGGIRHQWIHRAVGSMFLQTAPHGVGALIPGLVATAAVLYSSPHIQPEARKEAEPLLHKLSVILQYFEINEKFVEQRFRSSTRSRIPGAKLHAIKDFVLDHWRDTKNAIKNDFKGQNEKSSGLQAALFTKKMHKELRARKLRRDHLGVTQLWQTLKENLAEDAALAAHLRADPDFLDFWLYVWCSSRHPDKAHETTEMMRAIGSEPTVKSYTAMMHGWKAVKDIPRIDGLWKLLTQSHFPLDHVIWTERISAYIEAGRVQAGVAALGEMMKLWQDAVERGVPETAVQPTTQVVNPVLKGLLRVDRKAAHEVLAWAGKMGIAPDVFTYNMLIREGFRNGTPAAVQNILRNMKAEGIEPDAATFTVILEEVLSNLHHATAAQQVAAVDRVFADMEGAGLQPHLETYGKMLHAVAGLPTGGADQAVDRVLAHMQEHNFTISPHMVTILITRLLSASAIPNIQAMEALLAKSKMHDVSQGDQTLWANVMTAYATVGDTRAAMAIFTELQKSGRVVTVLHNLTPLLKSLLGERQRAEAQEVVRAVLASKMEAERGRGHGHGHAEDVRYYKHHFWFLAQENGLLDGLALPAGLQLALSGKRGSV